MTGPCPEIEKRPFKNNDFDLQNPVFTAPCLCSTNAIHRKENQTENSSAGVSRTATDSIPLPFALGKFFCKTPVRCRSLVFQKT